MSGTGPAVQSPVRLPDFFIIGAAKSGTTALHEYLGQHPDVFVTPHKEPPFFSLEYDRGMEYYWRTYFGAWRGERVAGESGGKLFPFAETVAARMAEHVPGARLIALLREPVARAHSHWWMNVSRGRETLGFAEAVERNLADLEAGITFETLADEPRWRAHVAASLTGSRVYVNFGHYARQLRPFMDRFPRDRMLVLSFDDLQRDAAAITGRCFAFLGVDPGAVSPDLTPRNTAGTHRTSASVPGLSRLSRASGLSRLLPAELKARLRERFFRRPAKPTAPDPRTVARLREHYAPHNRALAELLGPDAPAWATNDAA